MLLASENILYFQWLDYLCENVRWSLFQNCDSKQLQIKKKKKKKERKDKREEENISLKNYNTKAW